MACQPGYIEIDGDCIYDFGSEINPDGTVKTDKNGSDFWDNAGDFVKDNAGEILVILGGILGGKKKDADPAKVPSPKPQQEKEKSSLTWLWITLGVIAAIALLYFAFKKKAVSA